MRRSESQRPVFSSGARRLAASLAIVLALPLAGCFLGSVQVPAALDIPNAYRYGPRAADAALPSVVWWRGFRSRELAALIEEALTSNFDVAIAVARIVQADAQSRIAGAPLLPAVDFNGNASRSTQVTRSTSGARTGRRCARPNRPPSPAASTARWWH